MATAEEGRILAEASTRLSQNDRDRFDEVRIWPNTQLDDMDNWILDKEAKGFDVKESDEWADDGYFVAFSLRRVLTDGTDRPKRQNDRKPASKRAREEDKVELTDDGPDPAPAPKKLREEPKELPSWTIPKFNNATFGSMVPGAK